MTIADKITRLQAAKTAIATAITSKGGTVAQGHGFESFAADIATIPTEPTEQFSIKYYDNDGNLVRVKHRANTNVGNDMYNNQTHLTTFDYGDSVIGFIGSNGFINCTSLLLTVIPPTATSLGNSCFENCSLVTFDQVPSGVVSIPEKGFAGCTSLTTFKIHSSIIDINADAFKNCTGLTEVLFLGTPTTINATTFSGCTNLTSIKVPWSEGAVAGAPWGATNATITYNHTP